MEYILGENEKQFVTDLTTFCLLLFRRYYGVGHYEKGVIFLQRAIALNDRRKSPEDGYLCWNDVVGSIPDALVSSWKVGSVQRRANSLHFTGDAALRFVSRLVSLLPNYRVSEVVFLIQSVKYAPFTSTPTQ